MNIFIDALAAVGFICILWVIYGILFLGFPFAGRHALLYLFCDGRDPRAEHLLRAADRARRVFLRGAPIVFVDCSGACPALRNLARSLEIEYLASSDALRVDGSDYPWAPDDGTCSR